MEKLFYSFILFLTVCFGTFTSTQSKANTFAGGIPHSVPYTYNGTVYDRYIVISRTDYNICSNTMALYFVSSEMTDAKYPNGSKYYSLGRAYDGGVPGFTTQPNGSHLAIFEAYNNSGVCSWHTGDPDAETLYHQGTYSLRSDASEAIHDHNFDLYTSNSDWGTLPYTFSSPYTSWGIWRGNRLKLDGEGFLSFPLENFNPYTAEVTSVMDQDTLGTGSPYYNNGTVEAFTGETGNIGPYSDTTCYRNSGSTSFLTGVTPSFNYDGYTGGPSYLCYDGHPGYDYKEDVDETISATAWGYLCVATSVTTKPSPATSVWRDISKCPLANGPAGDDWTDYHTIYIMHGLLYINGSTDEYMTVYLHTKDLDTTVESSIFDDGYAEVNKLQSIGRVGNKSTPGNPVGYHVHMEVYKKVSSTWQRVDPYGTSAAGNLILWDH